MNRRNVLVVCLARFRLFARSGLAAVLLSSCGHRLIIEANPINSDIYVSEVAGERGRHVGQTPLELDIGKVVPSGTAFISIHKPGYESVQVLVDKGLSIGNLRQYVRFNLQSAKAVSTLADNLINKLRDARAMSRRGLTKEAHNEVDRAIGLNPNFVYAHYIKAGMYYQSGQWGAAVTSYQNVLRLQPGYLDAVQKMASATRQLKKLRVPASTP